MREPSSSETTPKRQLIRSMEDSCLEKIKMKQEGVLIYDERYDFALQDFDGDIETEYDTLHKYLAASLCKYPDLKKIIKNLEYSGNKIAILCYYRVFKKYLEMIPEWGAYKPWKKKEFPVLDFTDENFSENIQTSMHMPSQQTIQKLDFVFASHSEKNWGNSINLSDHWSQWQITGVVRGEQAAELGVKIDDRIIAVDGVNINKENHVKMKQKLCTGHPGKQTFLRTHHFRRICIAENGKSCYMKVYSRTSPSAIGKSICSYLKLNGIDEDILHDAEGDLVVNDSYLPNGTYTKIMENGQSKQWIKDSNTIHHKKRERVFNLSQKKTETLKKQRIVHNVVVDEHRNNKIFLDRNDKAVINMMLKKGRTLEISKKLKVKFDRIQAYVKDTQQKLILFHPHIRIGIRLIGNRVVEVYENTQAIAKAICVGWVIKKVNGITQRNNANEIYAAINRSVQNQQKTMIEFTIPTQIRANQRKQNKNQPCKFFLRNTLTPTITRMINHRKEKIRTLAIFHNEEKGNALLMKYALPLAAKQWVFNAKLLPDSDAIVFSFILKNTSTLTYLDLSRPLIQKAGAHAIINVLQQNKTIIYLNFSKCNLEDDVTFLLAEMLAMNNVLKKLELLNNQIGIDGARALGEVLKFNKTLTDIDLGMNKIGCAGAKAIGEALEINSTLQILSMKSNDISFEGMEAITVGLCHNSSLQDLNLDENKIDVRSATEIANALNSNSTLTKLHMRANILKDIGFIDLTLSLQKNKHLLDLNLDQNRIGTDCASGITMLLAKNIGLKVLSLSNNEINFFFARALATSLEQNTILTKLHLQRNKINGNGIKAICRALLTNSILTELQLHENHMGDTGAEAIETLLETNSVITVLTLGTNRICDSGAEAVRRGLKKNTSITYINLHGNRISIEVQQKIRNEFPMSIVWEKIPYAKFAKSQAGLQNRNLTHLEEDALSYV